MMADQKRWFKVWTSIAANARFAEMSLEDVGRWTLLGAATALDGDHGRLEVPGRGKELCRLLRVDDIDAARHALKRLHSVQFEEGENRHGELSVTWKNWKKYLNLWNYIRWNCRCLRNPYRISFSWIRNINLDQ